MEYKFIFSFCLDIKITIFHNIFVILQYQHVYEANMMDNVLSLNII